MYDFNGGASGSRCFGTWSIAGKKDGSCVVQHFKLEDGAVMLAPDVREYFPDADAVNQALRALIGLIPRKNRSGAG